MRKRVGYFVGSRLAAVRNWLSAHSTPLTAGTALVAIVLSCAQWYETRRAMVTSQRAWLLATDLRITGQQGQVTIRNTGPTAATNVTYRAVVIIAPVDWLPTDRHVSYSLHAEKPAESLFSGPGVLVPGKDYEYGPSQINPLPAEVADRLKREVHRPYLIGEVEYSDVFGGRRRTRFCQTIKQGAQVFCSFFNSIE